jgi:hypothetical protein
VFDKLGGVFALDGTEVAGVVLGGEVLGDLLLVRIRVQDRDVFVDILVTSCGLDILPDVALLRFGGGIEPLGQPLLEGLVRNRRVVVGGAVVKAPPAFFPALLSSVPEIGTDRIQLVAQVLGMLPLSSRNFWNVVITG